MEDRKMAQRVLRLSRLTRISFFLAAVAVATAVSQAADTHKNATASRDATVVDSGSFGILVNGKRVATETFKMEQKNNINRATSELKFAGDNVQATQDAEMEITSSGLLKKYTWKEVQPSRAQIVVEPADEQFLVLHVSDGSAAPPKDFTHALTPATSILDDNFFSQMQVLTWKYMAMGCRTAAVGKTECNWSPQKLAVLNPHQEQSLLVTMEYTGRQMVKLNGVMQELNGFSMQAETGQWKLWLNDDTEVLRD
jgi:hypothetical protein